MQRRRNALVAAGYVVETREYDSFDTLFFSRLEYVPTSDNVVFKHRLPGGIGSRIGRKMYNDSQVRDRAHHTCDLFVMGQVCFEQSAWYRCKVLIDAINVV